jgi:hypothetical protein
MYCNVDGSYSEEFTDYPEDVAYMQEKYYDFVYGIDDALLIDLDKNIICTQKDRFFFFFTIVILLFNGFILLAFFYYMFGFGIYRQHPEFKDDDTITSER